MFLILETLLKLTLSGAHYWARSRQAYRILDWEYPQGNKIPFNPFIWTPLFGYILNPYILNPYILNPYILNPYILNPYILNPYILNPYILNPYI